MNLKTVPDTVRKSALMMRSRYIMAMFMLVFSIGLGSQYLVSIFVEREMLNNFILAEQQKLDNAISDALSMKKLIEVYKEDNASFSQIKYLILNLREEKPVTIAKDKAYFSKIPNIFNISQLQAEEDFFEQMKKAGIQQRIDEIKAAKEILFQAEIHNQGMTDIVQYLKNSDLEALILQEESLKSVVDKYKKIALQFNEYSMDIFMIANRNIYIFFACISLIIISQWFLFFKPLFKTISKQLSEAILNQQKMKEIAYKDSLTQIHNRLGFYKELEKKFDKRDRSAKNVSVLLIDLDKFKPINDTYGHDAGDKILVEVAKRIQSSVRKSDIVARLGGDEFAVVISGPKTPKLLGHFIKRVHANIMQPVQFKNVEIDVDGSIGAAMSPFHGTNGHELLNLADKAMFFAKSSKKTKTCVYQDALYTGNKVREFSLEEIKTAFEKKEFYLVYQPIMDLSDGTISGFEAFIRWFHPNFGLVSPKDFISDIEAHGLLRELTFFVLGEALVLHNNWKRLKVKPGKIAVNLPEVVLQKDLNPMEWLQKELLKEEYQSSNIHDFSWLSLEISETIFQNRSSELIYNRINEFRNLGASIVLDNFGINGSSMLQFKNFDFDCLKINSIFTKNVAYDAKNGAIVRSLITLATAMDIQVLAEGIETKEQSEWLKLAGAEYAQGFYYAEPKSASQATLLIKKQANGGLENNIDAVA